MSFTKSNAIGRIGEEFVRKLLSDAGIPNQPNPEKTSRAKMSLWDVEATLGRTFHIEAKYDAMESKTGNIAVEYYNSRLCKPSGIHATASDLWAVVLQKPQSAWISRTQDLKDYFETVPCFRDIACGGDGNAAMKLFPSHEILPAIFHRIDGLGPEVLVKLLENLLETADGN